MDRLASGTDPVSWRSADGSVTGPGKPCLPLTRFKSASFPMNPVASEFNAVAIRIESGVFNR